ncbi:galactokinase [Salisediminibacterium selenitireducens]|uniref:Galactokinase n=1 Tax=Bacillus selenitireducens (strain ATCC 700615 / DSM 15326 / MLS10) TaxID=439292 RepID=D6XXA1_BACIE|nr:galactokinase [Salisediminibacterium selenitireducens]ADH97958.1 galactokinase [[Bacillus] selenitireducens MLS10]
MIDHLKQEFDKIFHESGELRYFFAPGRVNLIGEHIDYNGGYVFPTALDVGTYLAVRKRSDRKLRFYSENFPQMGIVEGDLDDLAYSQADDWVSYAKGVLYMFMEEGMTGDKGFDVYVFGNIPNGAGLSSSASIELAFAVMWDAVNGFSMDRVTMVKLCQRAENEYIGVNCGIMDQFAIGFGKKEHAVLLDCDTLDYEYARLKLDGYKILIANTNKRRGLADSKYNERRQECETALSELQEKEVVSHLCELDEAAFNEASHLIKGADRLKRARHAVTENERTKKAFRALEDGDLPAFGQLMNDSHVSLRDDYEVTGKELDAMVEAAWQEETVIGARMTGAGFGGCTVNIVKEDGLDETVKRISQRYTDQTGIEPKFYVVTTGDGAKELT